jgi:polyisoprenoid-binding protein YceI
LHTVQGSARLKHGSVRYAPATGELAGQIAIDARSADTGNDKRDKKMHEDVLESATYQDIVFRPERVSGARAETGPGRLTLTGTISIHGSDHRIELPVEVERDSTTLIVEGSFEVPYVAWGMNDPSVFLLRVKDYVTVEVRLVGEIQRVPEAATTP